MKYLIRPAITKDLPIICELVAQMSPGLPHDYREAEKKFEYLTNNPDYCLMVAEAYYEEYKWKVVGTSMIHFQHKLSYNCGLAGHLEDVVVDQKYRGKGIGQALVKANIKLAKDKGCYKLILGCYEKTAPFYEKLGFKKHDIGMRMDFKELYPYIGMQLSSNGH